MRRANNTAINFFIIVVKGPMYNFSRVFVKWNASNEYKKERHSFPQKTPHQGTTIITTTIPHKIK